jgi:hypothetical protein
MGTIDARHPASRYAGGRGRAAILCLTVFGLGVTVLAMARLAILIGATPPALRLIDFHSLAAAGAPVDDVTQRRAEYAAGLLADAELVPARLAGCRLGSAASPQSGDPACLDIVDQGLAAYPSSGELWWERARLLYNQRNLGDAFVDALRKSYRSSPREGWIASSRVLVGLRVYSILPEDLREYVRSDVAAALSSDQYAEPLVAAVASDERLIATVLPIIESLPEGRQQNFLWLVQHHVSNASN